MYKTAEGRAARKVADALNTIDLDPAMFAFCFATQPEAVQERLAAIVLALAEQWSANGYSNSTSHPNIKLLTDIVRNETA